MKKYASLLVLLFQFFLICDAFAGVYQIGGLYTQYYHDGRYADWGDYSLRAAKIAVRDINKAKMLGDNIIGFYDENIVDYHCWPEEVTKIAEEIFKKDILAVTGVGCSSPAVKISEVANKYKKVAISYGANAALLSSPEKYPYFIRVVTSSSAYEGYLVKLAEYYGMKKIALLYTTDAWGIGASAEVQNAALDAGMDVAAAYGYPRDTPVELVQQRLAEIKKLGIKSIFITMPTPDTVVTFRALNNLSMNQPGYSFFSGEMISADERPDAVNGALGYFAPIAKLPPSKRLDEFRSRFEAEIGKTVDPNSKAFFYAALSYDHMMAVGHALKKAQEAGEKDINGDVLMRHLRKLDFGGVSGRINFAPNTNDRANMAVEIMNLHGYKEDAKTVDFVPVGHVDNVTGKLFLDASKIIWPGNVKVPPTGQ